MTVDRHRCTSDAAFARDGHLDAARCCADERALRHHHRPAAEPAAVNDLVAGRPATTPRTSWPASLASGGAAAALAHQQRCHTDEHLNARGFSARSLTRRPARTCTGPGGPAAAHRRRPAVRPAPMLGQHTSTCTGRSSACPARSTEAGRRPGHRHRLPRKPPTRRYQRAHGKGEVPVRADPDLPFSVRSLAVQDAPDVHVALRPYCSRQRSPGMSALARRQLPQDNSVRQLIRPWERPPRMQSGR